MFEPFDVEGLIRVRPVRHGDARGWFRETWHGPRYREAGIDVDFVQDNESLSADRLTLRGLHFQRAPMAQAKLVRVVSGAIFDVAVDLRAGSATFGVWRSAKLSAEGGEQLFVPAGFAHGFLTLTANTRVAYKCSAVYAPELEGGIAWDDPALAIDWPLDGETPVLSARDAALPGLSVVSDAGGLAT